MEPASVNDASDKSEEILQATAQSDVKNDQQSANDDNCEDEDDSVEEDVPGDFFDDFLKEDFMAGLDIVDEDEGEEEREKKKVNSNEIASKLQQTRKPKRKKSPTRDKRHKAKKVKRRMDEKGDSRKHRRNSSEERKRDRRSRDNLINSDEFDIRRDPKKTKRDIERDKAKCEKDKEKKIITEKLQLVETGLVPPGMEMDVDVEEVKKQKEELERKEISNKMTSRSRSPRRATRSIEGITPKKRTKSPIIFSSPRRRIDARRFSPRRSPRRISPRRSPIRRSPIRRSRERSLGRVTLRRSRSLSPYYRSRRMRYSPIHRRASPGHDSYSRHRRSRSRSRSAKRKREEKKSFLQEIAEKLNETRPTIQMIPMQHLQPLPTLAPEVYNMNMQPLAQLSHPSPVPAPAPVPPPMLAAQFNPPQNHPPQNLPPHNLPSQNLPPQNHPPQNLPPQNHPPQTNPPQNRYDPYDQSFFIGTPQSGPVANYRGSQTQQAETLPRLPMPPNPVQNPVQAPQTSTNMNFRLTPQTIPRRLETKEDIAKLFQDKKITLSEFLSITAKPEVYSESPAHIQEKIKVISRCQDAIKILGNSEKKFTGPLIVRKSNKPVSPQDKFKSPLMKFSQLRIPFTDVPKKDQQRSSFTNYINHLLQSIGLMNEVVVEVDDQEEPSSVGTSTRLEEALPPPPPQISHSKSTNHIEPPARKPNSTQFSSNQLSKFVQTEVWKCQDCERRNKILYKTSGVQCGGDSATFSVGTQVTEDDFFVKIPKNQSLASLTPAQLLAKSGSTKFGRNVDIDDFDMMFASKNARTSFGRGSEPYGLPRYNPPSPPSRFLPPNRDDPGFPFFSTGGRGRGNQPPSSFSNNYY